jgi:hypothetical protein
LVPKAAAIGTTPALSPASHPWLAAVDGRTVVFRGRTNRPLIPWVVARLALD